MKHNTDYIQMEALILFFDKKNKAKTRVKLHFNKLIF